MPPAFTVHSALCFLLLCSQLSALFSLLSALCSLNSALAPCWCAHHCAGVFTVRSLLCWQGVRGVSIVFASGDSGYQPVQKFGAASPYVTAVGGVYNGELRDEELQASPTYTSPTTRLRGSENRVRESRADWMSSAESREHFPEHMPLTALVSHSIPYLNREQSQGVESRVDEQGG